MDNAHHRSQQLQLIPPVHRCRLLFVTLQKYKSRELEIYCETVSHYESVAVGAGGGGETDRSVRVSFHFHSARSHTPVRCVTAQKAKKRKKKGRRKEMDGWQFIHSFSQSVIIISTDLFSHVNCAIFHDRPIEEAVAIRKGYTCSAGSHVAYTTNKSCMTLVHFIITCCGVSLHVPANCTTCACNKL